MIKILGKLTTDNKVLADYMYQLSEDFEIGRFDEYVKEICYHLDIPAPIVLTKHIRNFIIFNYTHFTPDDFVEKVYFEKFTLVNARTD